MHLIPRPSQAQHARYKIVSDQHNLTLVWYFSAIALVVFSIHLLHHFRLGAQIFSPQMLPYTLVYSFNILYAACNLVMFPFLRGKKALASVAHLLELAYPFYIGVMATFLAILGVQQGQGPVPFVMGLLVISIMLQGYFIALLVLLISCWILLSFGLYLSMSVSEAAPSIMVGFTVIIVCTVIGRLTEQMRLKQFEMIEILNEKNRELELVSNQDPLTWLSNRRHFATRLEAEIARSKRYVNPLVLLLMDLDDFKIINDTLGHNVGDQVLCKVADIIQKQLREMDVLCRYGGDEFIILLVETSADDGLDVAERIRQKIYEHKFADINRQLSVSVGHAVYSGQTPEQFISKADSALYASKRQGKNHVSLSR